MHNYAVSHRILAFLCLLTLPAICFAVDTQVWDQSEQADFARGTPKHLSIRSDGHITLAPEVKELDSTSTPYLWAVAQNSAGTLFYAGGAPTGATAKITELAPGGKPKILAELPGLEVHTLAVDSKDRLYAAVLPDAKIYRIEPGGKFQLFFDPKCKYIWSMVFDRSGNLFIATGDSGIIYKVTPDGKGTKFFETNETHARSMILDASGNLIIGTDPGGLILRVTPEGKGFVLYQANKREVTAVAERDGVIYAAAIGSRPAVVAVTGPAPVLPSPPAAPVMPSGTIRLGSAPPKQPPTSGSLKATVTGGSDFYRIEKNGFAEQIWSSPTDLAYAIAFDAAGHPLIGTGNKGVIYRVDSDQLSTELLNTPPTQVTALLQGRGGVLYAVTGNVGNLYAIGPALQARGTLDSEALDAHDFAYWGKAHIKAVMNGGTITIETRSGNLNNPENHWSAWSPVPLSDNGGAIASPPARFLQYRLTLCRSSDSRSPDLNSVDIAYLPKNVAPKVERIDMAPFNYREAPTSSALERTVMQSGSPASLTLPPVGKKPSISTLSLESAGAATLQYRKGWVTARWSASDANDDPLVFTVEIKSEADAHWHPLKQKLTDAFYAFDSTTMPDGRYRVRVTASDAPGNIPSQALTGSLETDPFVIDNTPPEIINIARTGSQNTTITFRAKDALSWIDKAEYSANGGDWVLVQPEGKVTDSRILTYKIQVPAGQDIAIRVFDEYDNVAVKQVPAR